MFLTIITNFTKLQTSWSDSEPLSKKIDHASLQPYQIKWYGQNENHDYKLRDV